MSDLIVTTSDDATYIYLVRGGSVHRTVSVADGVLIDYDASGNALGIEVIR